MPGIALEEPIKRFVRDHIYELKIKDRTYVAVFDKLYNRKFYRFRVLGWDGSGNRTYIQVSVPNMRITEVRDVPFTELPLFVSFKTTRDYEKLLKGMQIRRKLSRLKKKHAK